MSDTQYHFPCTFPALTPVASPVTVQCQLGVCTVDRIRWRMPPGPNGTVGFYIASSLNQVIPATTGQVPNWIIANNEWDVIELDDLPDSGDWQVVGYNTGAKAHTLQVTFSVTVGGPAGTPGGAGSSVGTLIANADLSSLG